MFTGDGKTIKLTDFGVSKKHKQANFTTTVGTPDHIGTNQQLEGVSLFLTHVTQHLRYCHRNTPLTLVQWISGR